MTAATRAADDWTPALRRALIGATAFLLLLALAAWQIPPLLDWARYRQAIAAIASARLGRPVTIGGNVHFSLLPQPELTAEGVTLADRGDGLSARIGALRLTVAIGPLLHGHLAPLTLKLDDPLLTVPWPLPRVPAAGVPTIAQGFAAHVEGGTLQLGALTLGAVNADIHADSDSGAFAGSGTATLGGAQFRFSAIIGAPGLAPGAPGPAPGLAPGLDGVATLSLTLDGQGKLAGAGGTLRGRILADGALAGTAHASGPNLSALLPAPPLPWRIEGPVQASEGLFQAPKLYVALGESPGTATATLRLAAPPRLDATVALGQLPLGAWLFAAATNRPTLPIHLAVSAAAATLSGTAGTLRDPAAVLLLGPDHGAVEQASATLPGGATLTFAGTLQSGRNALLSGPLHLRAPNVAATVAWLRASLPAWPAANFIPLPLQAEAAADMALGRNAFALTHLRAALDGTDLQGEIGFSGATRGFLHAAFAADRIAHAEWLRSLWARPATLAAGFGAFDAALSLQVAHLEFPGLPIGNLALNATADARGIIFRHLAADLSGAHLEVRGGLAPNGNVSAAKLTLDTADAARLPASWRRLPLPWQGPLHLAVAGAGPADAVALQARCDLGDMRAEAEGQVDTATNTVNLTATLRHPGAPRLLQQAGLPNADRWLDQGSVAAIAHLVARPAWLQVHDISVSAGALRATGQAELDFSGAVPTLVARIDAPRLALPAFDAWSRTPWTSTDLAGWQGQLHLAAAELLADLHPVARNVAADITLANGVLAARDIAAQVADGTVRGDAALDSVGGLLAASGSIENASTDRLMPLPPFTWHGGRIDATLALTAEGHSPAAMMSSLSGTSHGTLAAAALGDVDLNLVAALLARRGPHLRAALTAAMSTGDTGPLSGAFVGTLDNGALSLAAPDLAGQAGGASVAATLDAPARTEDAAVRVRPAVRAAPTLGVRLAGSWQAPRRDVDVADALAWAGKSGKESSSFLKKRTKKSLPSGPAPNSRF